MRAPRLLLAIFAIACITSRAFAGDVDLTGKPEGIWHNYIGKTVSISGRYVRFGKFGPAVSTGQG